MFFNVTMLQTLTYRLFGEEAAKAHMSQGDDVIPEVVSQGCK